MNKLKILADAEKVLETQRSLESLQQFSTFAALKREFEERLLLDEINQEDGGEKQHSRKDCTRECKPNDYRGDSQDT